MKIIKLSVSSSHQPRVLSDENLYVIDLKMILTIDQQGPDYFAAKILCVIFNSKEGLSEGSPFHKRLAFTFSHSVSQHVLIS